MLGATDLRLVVLCASLSYLFVGSNSLVCYLYTPEIYPTRLRALGTAIATAWLRAGSAVGPVIVGFMLTRYPLRAVFLMFALVSVVGWWRSGSHSKRASASWKKFRHESSPQPHARQGHGLFPYL
jgi:MFS family permease